MRITNVKKGLISLLLLTLIFEVNLKTVSAQTDSNSVLYVPLIGLSSAPDPLTLPSGGGRVTYNYAVKSFLHEVPLTDIQVVDNKCSPVKFISGDDNNDSLLDSTETWRYICSTKISKTTESTATATGIANNVTATHKAYATVVVGSSNPPPLVNIVNITKIADSLQLPDGGGEFTYTYKVNNPGVVPLSDVTVTDDKCNAMSGKLGDTNANNLLDTNEVWIYSCMTMLTQSTTHRINVTAFANGLEAISNDTFTVNVVNPIASSSPALFDIGTSPGEGTNSDLKSIIWLTLFGILSALSVVFILTRKERLLKSKKELVPLENSENN